jgi:hypothetical protein
MMVQEFSFLSKDPSLMVTSSIVALPMTCMRFKNEYTVSALVIGLLATVALITLKSVDAQVLPRTTVEEVLSESTKQKIANLKTNHPELGALADKLQTVNVTQVTNEIAAILDFGQTMVIAIKNLQGYMSAGQ